MKPQSTQSMARNLLKAEKNPVRMKDIRDRIGLSGELGFARVNKAIRSLMATGEVKRTSHGSYQWANEIPDTAYCKVQNSLWRLMWIRTKKMRPFTARDLHETTGAALDTVKKYITFLLKSGHLDTVGSRKAYKSKAPVYLISEDKMSAAPPILRRHRKAADKEKCLHEIREQAAVFFRQDITTAETPGAFEKAIMNINALLKKYGQFDRSDMVTGADKSNASSRAFRAL